MCVCVRLRLIYGHLEYNMRTTRVGAFGYVRNITYTIILWCYYHIPTYYIDILYLSDL